MPEQKSNRGLGVTSSPFEQPFETPEIPLGVKGLNLHDDMENLDPGTYTRLTNGFHDTSFALTSRPGLTALATGGTNHHSVHRYNDPDSSTFTRIWGVDTGIRLAQGGALPAAIDSGYSGDPLTFVPHRPPLSGEPWMFIADRTKMQKVRADGLDLPIGLPAPGAAAVTSTPQFCMTLVAQFDSSDASEASHWTGTAGADADEHASDAPTAADEPGNSGGAVEFTTVPGTTVKGAYDSWWGMPRVRDLSVLAGMASPVPATDDDFIHFWMNLRDPHKLAEFRLYFVVSATFDATIVPGTDPDGAKNTDAYVKTIRQSDFADYIQRVTTQIEAAEVARVRSIRDLRLARLRTPRSETVSDPIAIIRGSRDTAAKRSIQTSPAAREWVRFGYFEIPLRRLDFERIGSNNTRDWSDVTGLILYVRTVDESAVAIRLDELFTHGGFGPDTTEPGSQPYDYRYTHYDPRTGAEGNGSPIMAEAKYQDTDRKQVWVDPGAYGDGAMRQRIYRRGGSLVDDWFYVGTNSGDGALLIDELSDDAIAAAGTMPIDHFEAIPTVNETGATVLRQAVPILFGPYEGILIALGDPHRPGHVYWCLPDAPDHWSATNNHEVCAPSEELMNGCLYGGQPYVFSRERLYALYPNLSGEQGMHSLPSGCTRGLISRWGMCLGPGGIFFVASDGIFVTSGGAEQKVSAEIEPLFLGLTRNGYLPIDKTAATAFRLVVFYNELYFQYQDTAGARQWLICDLESKTWRHYRFAVDTSALALDDGNPDAQLLVGGRTSGKAYTHAGFTDDGTAIPVTARLAAWHYGRPREDKLFGDQFLDLDRRGLAITFQNFLNAETHANVAGVINEGTGRTRVIMDAFGTAPQKARSLSTELSWSSSGVPPVLYRLGASVIPQPDLTMRRVTQWQDGGADETYLTGVTFDVDTGNFQRTIQIEYDFNGVVSTAATLLVQTNGRHKVKFSWPAVQAHLFRVRPDDECKAWLLYKADWIHQEEPPRIAHWDVHFENSWDAYYTGLDLYCDTGGVTKTIEVFVDGTLVVNPATGGTTFPVTANGRKVVHLTLTWGRGHVFRFRATDENPGLLYQHRWHLQEEPSEQANWNQNFTDAGTLADKWFKAFAFEIDTFGQTKSVDIEVDGVVVETLPVMTNGRKVVQLAMSQQHLGRILRVFPSDAHPSRPYRIDPIFDVEPYQLNRWETQETTHGVKGYKTAIDAHITLVSTADVTLTVTIQRSQLGAGAKQTLTYTIPSTAGVKLTRHLHFDANKGVLFKYLLTSTAAFHLYREESTLMIQPWGAANPTIEHPFGNDDLDATRGMSSATLSASRSGGTAD